MQTNPNNQQGSSQVSLSVAHQGERHSYPLAQHMWAAPCIVRTRMLMIQKIDANRTSCEIYKTHATPNASPPPNATSTGVAVNANDQASERPRVNRSSSPRRMISTYQHRNPSERALMRMAEALGYSLLPVKKLRKEIATAIGTRMRKREGLELYQTLAFTLPAIPKHGLDQILPRQLVAVSGTEGRKTTWVATTYPQIRMILEPLLSECDFFCVGITRGLKTKSERVIRVIAMPIPVVEFEHAEQARGLDRLTINMQYVLATETGELHKPKDERRRDHTACIPAHSSLSDPSRP